MEQNTKDIYYIKKTDTDYSYTGQPITIYWYDLKREVKYYWDLKNTDLKDRIKAEINNCNEGLFYKGFEICFKYEGEKYYLSHHHKTEIFIKNIIDILKEYKATDIFISAGELD